jgi:hypothetical protein
MQKITHQVAILARLSSTRSLPSFMYLANITATQFLHTHTYLIKPTYSYVNSSGFCERNFKRLAHIAPPLPYPKQSHKVLKVRARFANWASKPMRDKERSPIYWLNDVEVSRLLKTGSIQILKTASFKDRKRAKPKLA